MEEQEVIQTNTETSTAEPVVQPEQTQEQPQEAKPEDLMTRVAAYEADNKPDKDFIDDGQEFKGKEELAKIQDPQAREYAEKAHNSVTKAFNRKFQELAELRKSLETQQNHQENWTTEKVQTLINDPNFVQVAQQVAGQQPTNDEYSALSDIEKQEISQLKTKLVQLEQQNQQSINLTQHEILSKKYPNYDSQAVDTIKADLIAGKAQVTNEHVYWGYYGPQMAKASYEMGKKDALSGNADKVQSMSIDGQNTVSSPSEFKKEEGESNKNFFRRIGSKVLSDLSGGQQIR